eukprot:4543988-Amphidinium_carterae.1
MHGGLTPASLTGLDCGFPQNQTPLSAAVAALALSTGMYTNRIHAAPANAPLYPKRKKSEKQTCKTD